MRAIDTWRTLPAMSSPACGSRVPLQGVFDADLEPIPSEFHTCQGKYFEDTAVAGIPDLEISTRPLQWAVCEGPAALWSMGESGAAKGGISSRGSFVPMSSASPWSSRSWRGSCSAATPASTSRFSRCCSRSIASYGSIGLPLQGVLLRPSQQAPRPLAADRSSSSRSQTVPGSAIRSSRRSCLGSRRPLGHQRTLVSIMARSSRSSRILSWC